MTAQEFTDLQRKKITQEAYNDENYILGTETSIDKGKTSLGTVVKVVADVTMLRVTTLPAWMPLLLKMRKRKLSA